MGCGQPLACCSSAIVGKFTYDGFGWGAHGKEITGGYISHVWEVQRKEVIIMTMELGCWVYSMHWRKTVKGQGWLITNIRQSVDSEGLLRSIWKDNHLLQPENTECWGSVPGLNYKGSWAPERFEWSMPQQVSYAKVRAFVGKEWEGRCALGWGHLGGYTKELCNPRCPWTLGTSKSSPASLVKAGSLPCFKVMQLPAL